MVRVDRLQSSSARFRSCGVCPFAPPMRNEMRFVPCNSSLSMCAAKLVVVRCVPRSSRAMMYPVVFARRRSLSMLWVPSRTVVNVTFA